VCSRGSVWQEMGPATIIDMTREDLSAEYMSSGRAKQDDLVFNFM